MQINIFMIKLKLMKRNVYEREIIIMKLYVVREIDAFGDSYSYYVHAENEEKAIEIAIKRGLSIEQLTEIKEINEDNI